MEKRKINSLGLEVCIRVLLPQRDKEDNGKGRRWFLEMVLLKERDLSGCCLNSMGIGKGKQSTANTEVARLWHARVQKESR